MHNSYIFQIKNPHVRGKRIIPIYSPVLQGNEKKYLNECIDSGWISPKGNFVLRFEKEFASFCNSKYAIACSSGTSGLYLTLLANKLKEGDEVIVPTFTMISTALAVSYLKAKPIFVDCRLDDGNIDTNLILKAVTKKTKAIIPVHIYGNPAEMDNINEIAKYCHLSVIEDAAEAIGAKYKKNIIGSISPLTVFSLYVNKIVTAGQGGMITTNSSKLCHYIKRLNNYFFSSTRHFWHQQIGYNFKLTNLQAAVGLSQLEKIDELLSKKSLISKWYRNYLDKISENFIPLKPQSNVSGNEWMTAYRLLANGKFSAIKLRSYLARNGIETRSFFIPLHLQPIYRKLNLHKNFPNSEQLIRSGVLLPSGPGLTQEDVKRICKHILSCFSQ